MSEVIEAPSSGRKGKSATAAPVGTAVKLLTTSPKGGVGKTSASRNIAVAAARDGFRVATLDCDPQGSLTKWWGRRPDASVLGDAGASTDAIMGRCRR